MAVAHQPQILLVEDDEAVAKLLKAYLESVGYEVQSETSGVEALHYVFEHKPDLVILDLQLPDIHGYEVYKELRSLYPPWAMPVMMLTGMDTSLDKLRGLAYGADAYLTKPFEPPALLPTITRLLGKTTSE